MTLPSTSAAISLSSACIFLEHPPATPLFAYMLSPQDQDCHCTLYSIAHASHSEEGGIALGKALQTSPLHSEHTMTKRLSAFPALQ